MLILKRPLAFFDIEGTGLDLENDRVVELSICKYHPNGAAPEWLIQRFNPERPMSRDAAKITGIKDEDLLGHPLFAQLAADILVFMDGCDLGGYNLFQYDIPILQAEFRRCGLELNLEGRALIDPGNIFKKKEERTLAAAKKFYTGQALENAHNATADTQAAADVFFAQLERYPDLAEMSLEEIGLYSRFGLDLAGKFGRDDEGDYVYNFGNKRGSKVKDDPGLARWVLTKDFPRDTKQWASRILKEIAEERQREFESQTADVAPWGGH
jgi:DNA polymerase-3 subunit epsilon